MKVVYASNKLQAACEVKRKGDKAFGVERAEKVRRRVTQLRAAESTDDLKAGTGNWHPYGGYEGDCWSASLTPNWRIIVIVEGDEDDLNTTVAEVFKVEDYH